MKPHLIVKVLSTLSCHGVRHLLMGGQACVFYGAATFSVDCDVVIASDEENLKRLGSALGELKAERIAVPPFDADYLRRGHAVHFRCEEESVSGLRLDVMARLRGVDEFDVLWSRRTELRMPDGAVIAMLSIADLTLAKKTQRDKDWPMIRVLIENQYLERREGATPELIEFWFLESRTPSMLMELAAKNPGAAEILTSRRSLIEFAVKQDEVKLEEALLDEQMQVRAADRAYWAALRKELEDLRRQRLDDLRREPPL